MGKPVWRIWRSALSSHYRLILTLILKQGLNLVNSEENLDLRRYKPRRHARFDERWPWKPTCDADAECVLIIIWVWKLWHTKWVCFAWVWVWSPECECGCPWWLWQCRVLYSTPYFSMARVLRRKCFSWHWNIPSSSKTWIWSSPVSPQVNSVFPAIGTNNSVKGCIISPTGCNTLFNSTSTTSSFHSKCNYSDAPFSPSPSRWVVNWRAYISWPWSISEHDF